MTPRVEGAWSRVRVAAVLLIIALSFSLFIMRSWLLQRLDIWICLAHETRFYVSLICTSFD